VLKFDSNDEPRKVTAFGATCVEYL